MIATAVSPLNKINLPNLPRFQNGDFSSIYWQNKLYLATIIHQQQTSTYQVSLFNYDFVDKQWQQSYQKDLFPGDYIQEDSDNLNLESINDKISIEIIINQDKNEHDCLELNFLTYFVTQRLRSEDGINFYVLDSANLGDNNFRSLHQLLPSQNYLYGLPTTTALETSKPELNIPLIYYYQKQKSLKWQTFSSDNFGGNSNQNISTLALFNDYIYAGTTNLEAGFQLWKTPANAPQTWELVMTKGAYGYAINQQVSFLVEFKGELYLASSVAKNNTTRNEFSYFYNCGFELIRFYPDDDWDIIVGKPKFTPDGLKVPLAVMGAGFDDPYNQEVNCLVVHHNRLYLGCQSTEGFQLWCSEDGETWEQIPLDKFNNYRYVELETAVSTSAGLALLIRVNNTNDLQLWLVEVLASQQL